MLGSGCRTATIALLLLTPDPLTAPDVLTAERTIDTMNTLHGSYAGFRGHHPEGVAVEGSVTPAPAVVGSSEASLFQGPIVPVTAGVSDATGVPTLPDGATDADPHGLPMTG